MDDFLAAGSLFDWITPLYALIRDVIEDGVEMCVPLAGNEFIKEKLESRGIKTWGWQISGTHWIFSIHRSKRAWAEYVLSLYGGCHDEKIS